MVANYSKTKLLLSLLGKKKSLKRFAYQIYGYLEIRKLSNIIWRRENSSGQLRML